MIYAFTEVEKEQIESSGMMVVEFKRNLRMIESMGKAVSHAWNGLIKLAEVVGCSFSYRLQIWQPRKPYKPLKALTWLECP